MWVCILSDIIKIMIDNVGIIWVIIWMNPPPPTDFESSVGDSLGARPAIGYPDEAFYFYHGLSSATC